MIRLLMLCLALLAGAPAIAQTPPDYRPGGATTSTNPLPVQLRCWNGTAYQPCSLSGGGGGGGGDASAANQLIQIALETAIRDRIGDPANPAAGTLLARNEQLRQLLANPLAVTQSGTWTVNLGSLNGAATNAAQTAVQSAPGTSAATAVTVQGATAGVALPVNAVLRATTTSRSAVVGTTATNLMAANTSRQGFAIQVQGSSGACYINGLATATADQNSLMIPAGGYFETTTHVGTGAVSIICTVASTPVWAREW